MHTAEIVSNSCFGWRNRRTNPMTHVTVNPLATSTEAIKAKSSGLFDNTKGTS